MPFPMSMPSSAALTAASLSRRTPVRLLALLAATVMALGLTACGGGSGSGSSAGATAGGGTGTSGGSTGGGSGTGTTPPPPSGSITISWTAPQTRADGTPLTDLAGYRIYYGTSSGNYTSSVTISSPSTTSYTIGNLAAGTYYLTMKSFNVNNVESAGTPEASKVVN